MDQTEQLKFDADNFWILATETLDSMEPPGTLRNKDRTQLFWYEIEQRVKKGELININFNGRVRSGKSTAAQYICNEIKKMIKKHHKLDRPMSNKNITRDQNEYSRLVKRRPEEYKHECDVIDEWQEMEQAGYNSTVEEKYLKSFSDVQAGRYYHRIACSPENVTDKNSDILLETVPGSKKNGELLCIISYRLTRGDIAQPIIIGHIRLSYKEIMTAHWYKEYLKKKEEKWELMNKHNVKSPRELEYAQIILNTYEKMKSVAKYGLNKRKHFKITLTEEADKVGVWFSILGDRDVLETLEGLGELTEVVYVTEAKLKKLFLKKEAGENVETTLKEVAQYLKELKLTLARQLERKHQLAELWKQYQLIDETTKEKVKT